VRMRMRGAGHLSLAAKRCEDDPVVGDGLRHVPGYQLRREIYGCMLQLPLLVVVMVLLTCRTRALVAGSAAGSSGGRGSRQRLLLQRACVAADDPACRLQHRRLLLRLLLPPSLPPHTTDRFPPPPTTMPCRITSTPSSRQRLISGHPQPSSTGRFSTSARSSGTSACRWVNETRHRSAVLCNKVTCP